MFGSAKNAVVNVVMKAFNFTLKNPFLLKDNQQIKDSDDYDIPNQSKITKLYPAFETVMNECENYFHVFTNNKTLNIPKKCIFYQMVFSNQLFKLMSIQYLIRKYFNNYLFFQCASNQSHLETNGTDLIKFTSNNTMLTDLKKLNEETSSSNQLIEQFDSTIISSTIKNNLPSTPNSTIIESSIPEPILLQTIMSTHPQSSIFVPQLNTIISSSTLLAPKMNDSNVLLDSNGKTNEGIFNNPSAALNLDAEYDVQSLSSMSGQTKEAVIVRLTSRIKNLEKNISLMSTYLENLSVRYRKQMEEMQKIFNQTLGHFNTSARIAAEKVWKIWCVCLEYFFLIHYHYRMPINKSISLNCKKIF